MGLLRERRLSGGRVLHFHISSLCFHLIQVFRINSTFFFIFILNCWIELYIYIINFSHFHSPSFSPPSLSLTPFPNKVLLCLLFVCDLLGLFRVLFLPSMDGRLANGARESSVATPLEKMTLPPPEIQPSVTFLCNNTDVMYLSTHDSFIYVCSFMLNK